MTKRKVIVIGGGASGMMAAGQAALSGAEVCVCEKMKYPGRKLRITGKGRCNLTNIAERADFIDEFGKTGKFLYQAFSQFFVSDLLDFFKEIGLDVVTERGGRVFPAGGQAPEVVEVLANWLNRIGVTVFTSSGVDALLIDDGRVCGVASNDNLFKSDAVIVATGGASYPLTGSTGDGYILAESAGHTIIPVRPALVPLETAGNSTSKMTDLGLRNVEVSLLINGKKTQELFGELVFTEFGVTGPVILSLSGEVVDALRENKEVLLSLNLKPALDEKKLDARLLRDFASRGKEPIRSVLRGLLPKEMVPVFLSIVKIPADILVSTITAEQRRKIRLLLQDFQLEITGHRPFLEAIITAGGVSTKEINPKTMESLKIKGLYIVGELLDIHANTGGYNLQAAFSTGYVAGRCAASEKLEI